MAKRSAAKVQEPDKTPVAEVTAEETPTEPPARPAYTSRASMIREIAERNRDSRDDQIREDGGDVVDTRGPAPAALPGEDEDSAAQRRDDDAPPAEEAAVPEETVEAPPAETPVSKKRFTIDGKEVELTDEQITAYVQKGATADHRLAEATRILDGAKRVTPAATKESAPGSQPSAPSPDAALSPSDQDVKELARTLLYGKEEEVVGALTKVIGGGRQASPEMAQRMATQTLGMTAEQITAHVGQAIAWENAKALFDRSPEQGGYSDIWSDPVLKNEFIRREDDLRDTGDERPYTVVHAEIAKGIREWRDGVVKKHSTKTGLEDRDNLKRGTGVVRGAGGTPPPPQVSQPKTHEEKLEGMRRARGQLK